MVEERQNFESDEKELSDSKDERKILDRLLLPNEVDVIRNPIFQGLQQRGKVLVSSEAFTQTGGIFDQIERIKEEIGDFAVYDLAVDSPHHSFTVPGLTVHNCGDWIDQQVAIFCVVNDIFDLIFK